jgi:protoporphyrinogen oxidase
VKIAVIGAGPAGLTSAYCLSKVSADVELYEASDVVGGLARSLRLWNQTVDIGPHRFFSNDRRVNRIWLEVVQDDYWMVNRLTRILYNGKFYMYPLRCIDVLAKLGPVEATTCLCSYGRERLFPRIQDGSFENWVCSRFGCRLFEIFFKTYSEKLWGIKCDELDADFAAQRIQRFSLSEAIKNVISVRRKSKHRTLTDQFAYPTGGTGAVYNRMMEKIRNYGGKVFLKTPIQQVLIERGRVSGIKLASGEIRNCNQVISSMPLTLLVSRLRDAPAEVLDASRRLTFRNTILVYLEVTGKSVCRDNWIYVHSPELRTGRITNYRNWAPQLSRDSDNTILSLEYWCNEDDVFWKRSNNDILSLARKELIQTSLVQEDSQILRGMVYRVSKCYPVYQRNYKSLLRLIREYLQGIEGLQVIGRYGAFKYNNQDHSILMGLLAAENASSSASHDLWNVNADYDTYQEGWTIAETGLVPSKCQPEIAVDQSLSI